MEINPIQSDFDKLALLDVDSWDHNSHYHNYLLKQIPANATQALEIGCGAGAFSRQLSGYVDRVLALDLSPEMIKLAQQRSVQYSNIEYQIADVLTFDFPEQQFDCVVSIATLHHLPLESTLQKLRSALKPNGMLLVLDLYEAEGLRDWMQDLLAVPVHTILKLKHTGRIRETREVRAAWAAHGANDTYLSVSEVRRICDHLLPGANVRKHLLWRYSIVWQNI
jgi:2-polyprenyl-3-methyl-5-hydroxy-6-metoxy-1,4-benzoquinol methylase